MIALDTKLGIILWKECPQKIADEQFKEDVIYDPEEDDEMSEEEASWRLDAQTRAIPDFFEVLKHQFEELYWIPISHHTVFTASEESELPGEEGMVAVLQGIYRQHGWPDLVAYRGFEYLEAVRKAMEEKCPDSACRRG